MNPFRSWSGRSIRSAGGGVLGCALVLPLLGFHFCWDQGVYATIADTMLHGGVAYRDAWEFRPPGGFFAYYLTFILFGENEWGIRLIEVLCVGLSSAGLVRLAERRFGSTVAGLFAAAILPLLHLNFGHWHTAEPESFQMPLVVWALALWPKDDEFAASKSGGVFSGLLLGAAAVVKSPALIYALVLGLDCLRHSFRGATWRDRLVPPALFALSFTLFPAAVAVYYASRGAFPEFYDAVFVFGPQYVRTFGGTASPSYHAARIWETLKSLLPVSGLLLLALGVLRSAFFARKALAAWSVMIFAALLQLVLQMKYIPYHAHILTPALSAGLGMSFVGGSPLLLGGIGVSAWTRVVTFWGVILLSVLFITQAAHRIAPAWTDLAQAPEHRAFHQGGYCREYWQESLRLAAAIREVTGPDDRIFLWANNPLPYFHSRRGMAGPYCSLFHVVAPWLGNERVYRLMERLDREQPKLIVIGADDGIWADGDAREHLKRNPPMRDFLERRYSPAAGVGKYGFWLRKDP